MKRNRLLTLGCIISFASSSLAAIMISSVEDLAKIGKDAAFPLTESYVLTKNIDASSTKAMNNGNGFLPIASGWGAGFTGTFDGAGYSITNLSIKREGTDGEFVGLFGTLDSGSVVKNLKVLDADIRGNARVGILVGRTRGLIENCVVSGRVSAVKGNVGGVAGTSGRWTAGPMTGIIRKTMAYVTVETKDSHAGGISGWTFMGTIEECGVFGSVKAGKNAGGIGGNGGNGYTINRCFSTATVEADSLSGGISGSAFSQEAANTGKITECWAAGKILGNKTGGLLAAGNAVVTKSWWDAQQTGVGGSVGSEFTFGETTDRMTKSSTYLDWDFSSVWKISEGKGYPSLNWMVFPSATVRYSAGSNGTVSGEFLQKSDPVTILSTVTATPSAGFEFIRWNDSVRTAARSDVGIYRDTTITAHFAAPIAISSISELQKIGSDNSYPNDYSYYLTGNLSGNGLTIAPICEGKEFFGTLDGRGRTISNLTISGLKSQTGLFGSIDNLGEIHSLTLDSITVNGAGYTGTLAGNNSGSIHKVLLKNCTIKSSNTISGGLVGTNFGTITDCRLTSISVTNDSLVSGGLVGYHGGGTISRSSVQAEVKALKHAGGFVGYVVNGALKECMASGSVYSNLWVAGGLIGYASKPLVENCYSLSSVTAGTDTTKDVGGLIGLASSGVVTNSYFSGKIIGGIKTGNGGILGRLLGFGTITNCFWDKTISGIESSDHGTGYSTSEMNLQSSFTDWDFTTIWEITGSGSPTLQWERKNPVGITVETKNAVRNGGLVTAIGSGIRIVLPAGSKMGTLKLYHTNGRLVYSSEIQQSGMIPRPALASGIYIARLHSNGSGISSQIYLK